QQMAIWAIVDVAERESAAELAGRMGNAVDGVLIITRDPEAPPHALPGPSAQVVRDLAEAGTRLPDDAELVVLAEEAVAADDVRVLAAALREEDAGATRAVPVTDALKVVRAGLVSGSVERQGLASPVLPTLVRRAALEFALQELGARDVAAVGPRLVE